MVGGKKYVKGDFNRAANMLKDSQDQLLNHLYT